MRIKRKVLVTNGVNFNIEFAADRLDLLFDAGVDRGQSPVFGRPFHESGLLRFQKNSDGIFSALLLFAPFDMFSQSDAEIEKMIGIVEAVSIKGFTISASLGNTLRETRAVCPPNSISEEGVEFSFKETERLWMGGATSKVSAESILSDIFISERISISLTNGGKPIMRAYATIEFDHLDDYRSAIASAFGRDYARFLAAQHGYDIED